jgi:hypothetical protein
MIAGWLEAQPEFSLARSVALFPPDSGTDGIYAASLRRT